VRKQNAGLDTCKWGCGEWVALGNEQRRHEKMECMKRIVPCSLGCSLAVALEKWEGSMAGEGEGVGLTFREVHEQVECPRRLTPCSNHCGEWVVAEQLEHHLLARCVKRPLPPLECRVGCGLEFKGE
jgi:hypothetical protein